jgi:hypothetical protein
MHIPYRSLLPKSIQGLLVVGRAIGGSNIAHAATRNMACCTVTGQGAGVAAAEAIKTKTSLNSVNISNVQKVLRAQNVRVF